MPSKVTGSVVYNADGTMEINIADKRGGTVTGQTYIGFGDKRNEVITLADNQGTTEVTNFNNGFRGTDKVIVNGKTTVLLSGAAFTGSPQAGGVFCDGHDRGWFHLGNDALAGILGVELNSAVRATRNVVDAVTKQRIDDFMKRHPELKEEMLQINPPIAHMSAAPIRKLDKNEQISVANGIYYGSEISMKDLGQFPQSHFTACPRGKTDVVVEKH